ncbi:hypothetical protein D9M68_871940 [compost metagenome]
MCPYILGLIKQSTGSLTGGLLLIAGIMLAGAILMVGSGSIRRGAAALHSMTGEKMPNVYAR